MTVNYEDTCELYCIDTDKTAVAEVMDFMPENRLTVAIAGNKIKLQWSEAHEVYKGKMAGLDFTTSGPNFYNVRTTR